ncbi:right-handed parallel beta-helix repeat-containing protein [Lewinella sp. 4G2]|uniref:right-handed parallel beta-helix repeat-containing protein n=1 Tax=Lewinella sp. 4G2 TaxID=1803372 RepID=UPI0007B48EBA|nr:right-handed parallel beta-helix repeat-containing protein [Lewinella sp. 4G2]OAV43492.1 hypothetical protein A3850_002825 [Lewinella sp. 4G2]
MKSILHLCVSLLFVLSSHHAHAQTLTLNASNCNPTDATACIQAALDDPALTRIVLADVGQNWISDALFIRRNGVTLELENTAVTLQAEPNALSEFESLVQIRQVDGVTIEGNGGNFLLDKTEYNRASQFRHGIDVYGATNATIQNLTITGAPGDGILVGPAFVQDLNDIDGDGDVTDFEPIPPCENIVIDNVICDDNNRQGISVSSVIGLLVTNSQFINTEGAEPESGVDFEPFRRYHVMQDIEFIDCEFSGNAGNGIQFAGVDINATTPATDIVIDRALVTGNGQDATRRRNAVDIQNIFNPFDGADITNNVADRSSSPGTFVLSNSEIRDEPWSGINVRQWADGLAVSIINTTVENVSNSFRNQGAGPILVQPPFYDDTNQGVNDPCYGNVNFENVRLIDDQTNRFQITVEDYRPGPSGPRDITGDICVEQVGAAAGTPIDTVFDSERCANFTLDVTACTVLPVTLSSFTAKTDVASCKTTLLWEVEEALDVAEFILESKHDLTDWSVVASQKVASDAAAMGKHTASTSALNKQYFRLKMVDVDGSYEYSKVVMVDGCQSSEPLRVWPNPVSDRSSFAPSPAGRVLRFIDLRGLTLATHQLRPGQTELSLAGLPKGIYTVQDLNSGQAVRLLVR